MNSYKRIFFLELLFFYLLTGCSKAIDSNQSKICLKTSKPCLDKKVRVVIKTSSGKFIVELDGLNAPLTAGNFLRLINNKFYEGKTFHRVIKRPYPFIIQGGNYNSKSSVYGNSNKLLPLEIKLINEKLPRYNFPITNPNDLSKLQLVHKRGAIAMARSQAINSGSTEFYIALKRLPELDGRYTVFGKIIEGIEVIDSIEKGDKIIETYSLN